jgi:hypothetical protein
LCWVQFKVRACLSETARRLKQSLSINIRLWNRCHVFEDKRFILGLFVQRQLGGIKACPASSITRRHRSTRHFVRKIKWLYVLNDLLSRHDNFGRRLTQQSLNLLFFLLHTSLDCLILLQVLDWTHVAAISVTLECLILLWNQNDCLFLNRLIILLYENLFHTLMRQFCFVTRFKRRHLFIMLDKSVYLFIDLMRSCLRCIRDSLDVGCPLLDVKFKLFYLSCLFDVWDQFLLFFIDCFVKIQTSLVVKLVALCTYSY